MSDTHFVQAAAHGVCGNPVSEPGDTTLTLLQAYNAQLVDVPITELVYPITDDRLVPVEHGMKVIIKALIMLHHQIQSPTVRTIDSGYEVVAGEAIIEAMNELGAETVSVVVIECDDETARDLRSALKCLRPEVPYRVRLGCFNEIKDAVRRARKLEKSSGKQMPTTDQMLAEVLDESVTHVKQLARLANDDNRDTIAGKLDSGTTLHNMGHHKTDSETPTRPVGCPVEVPEGFDMSVICPGCPRYTAFMNDLHQLQRKTGTNTLNENQNGNN